MGDRRFAAEGCDQQQLPLHAEYLTRYHSGDALSEFRGGPSGSATMCGKFTAMASWADVVDFSQPLTHGIEAFRNDRELAFRVMSNLPVVIWDRNTGQRRVVAMRWGFPDPKNWKLPRPIHARSESIEATKAFAKAFLEGQRGIVLVKTFNEAPDTPGKAVQHTITPDSEVSGIAFVWRVFEVGQPLPLTACVMVTVAANKLIAILPTDRMPAILDPTNWAKWLGETRVTVDDLKACLKTIEGVDWKMQREQREKPTVREPSGDYR